MDKQAKKKDMQAGVEAGSQARRETLDACKHFKVTPGFVISNLKRLARYKGKKPFHYQGEVVYSRPLDDTTAQLGALRELATLLDMKPSEKHEHTGKDGGPILTKALDLTDDELLNIARGRSAGASEKKTSAE